jgi:ABC-2 type transport system ATP-binding protein
MTDALVETRNLGKRFGARTALDGVSMTVSRGEIVGLLGHNGAGKSTLIGMLLGQVWPSEGEVRVCGCDVARDRQGALARVGAIFESPAFYDYLSGWRNLEVLAGYSGPTTPARLREVIEWVGLSGREDSLVRTYSHGMRARLALAQALLPNPELLILDEPGDGLDPEGTHEMRRTIRRLRDQLGLTILLSSHQLGEVEMLCDRITVLSRGRKVFEGSMDDTRRQGAWVRLRTDDFAAVTVELHAAGLISGVRGVDQVLPSTGVGTERIVQWLVAHGRPVFEIAAETASLEDFYLKLMGEGKEPVAP